MAQKYRIYINEKVILLTSVLPANTDKFQLIDNQYLDLKLIYHWVDKHHATHFYVLCDNAKELLKKVIRNITLIEAAGGLVKNQKGEYLFIYRNSKWDLPKGKIEKKEKTKITAVREVEEECGIKVDKLEDKICKTYHAYIYRGDVVLKKSHWFSMKYTGKTKLVPQTEEGITDVRWFNHAQIEMIIHNTYSSILDVLEKAELIKDRVGLLSE
jgi:8-oxo-dGTP pyrophosphatase MutT (NUDIX family)